MAGDRQQQAAGCLILIADLYRKDGSERIAENLEMGASALAREQEMVAVLRSVEFALPHRKCPSCFGWNASPSGETPYAHAKDCVLAAALAKAEIPHD